MVENDSYLYHVKKKPLIPQTNEDYLLITKERTQKLDLLVHLITNLSRSLVVCGPDGIGKSRLLKILQDRHSESYRYCFVQGDADLSLEKILELTAQAAKQINSGQSLQSLTIALSQTKSQGKKIVLIIDDAGFLVPGLITGIIRFAAENPALRVVFVLTYDDLSVKNRTDSTIDDCLFVEIPPLTEAQCGEFLRYLSTKPWTQLSFNSVNEGMIASIFQETRGIPGRIIDEVPVITGSKGTENSVWLLITAVAALVAIALGLQWRGYATNEIKETLPTSATDPQQVIGKLMSQPVSGLPSLYNKQAIEENVKLLMGESGIVAIDHNRLDNVQPLEFEQRKNDYPPHPETGSRPDKVKTVVSGIEKINKTGQELAGASIISGGRPIELGGIREGISLETQPPDNYTLQVITLSKERSVKDFLKKYQNLENGFSYIKASANGKQRFVLFYGSFTSFELADKAKQGLPRVFSQAVIKKISQVKSR